MTSTVDLDVARFFLSLCICTADRASDGKQVIYRRSKTRSDVWIIACEPLTGAGYDSRLQDSGWGVALRLLYVTTLYLRKASTASVCWMLPSKLSKWTSLSQLFSSSTSKISWLLSVNTDLMYMTFMLLDFGRGVKVGIIPGLASGGTLNVLDDWFRSFFSDLEWVSFWKGRYILWSTHHRASNRLIFPLIRFTAFYFFTICAVVILLFS